jgi:hypothetical protein
MDDAPEHTRQVRIVLWPLYLVSVALVVSVGLVWYYSSTQFIVCTADYRTIGVSCGQTDSTGLHYLCQVTSADEGVDFSKSDARIVTPAGDLLGEWPRPIGFDTNGRSPVHILSEPLSSDSMAVDKSPKGFGVGDGFYLNSTPPGSLGGSVFKLEAAGLPTGKCGGPAAGSSLLP